MSTDASQNPSSTSSRHVTSSSEDPSLDLNRLAADPGMTDTRLAESYSGVFAAWYASLKWCPTSDRELAQAEYQLLKSLTRPFRSYFVDIGQGWGKEKNDLRTIEMLTDQEIKSKDNAAIATNRFNKCPLVLVHGFAAGIGTWILNLDFLATNIDRKIYAFDIIGFGRSSRAPFNMSESVEDQFVESIERWREKQGIEKFILLGHSFGGYLSASYALRHPERVPHIILADPWGIQDRQASPLRDNTYKFPVWFRAVVSMFQAFNPLAVLRVSGRYGPTLVHKFRGDLREKFRPKLQDDCDKFLDYIYHCNAQTATGETAFKSLTLPYGWPKNPLIHRLIDMDERVDMTFIYGSRSWIEKAPGEFLRDSLTPNRVAVHIIQGSGHHVYADRFNEFNEIVSDACSKIKL